MLRKLSKIAVDLFFSKLLIEIAKILLDCKALKT
jgi:hypothetical protein